MDFEMMAAVVFMLIDRLLLQGLIKLFRFNDSIVVCVHHGPFLEWNMLRAHLRHSIWQKQRSSAARDVHLSTFSSSRSFQYTRARFTRAFYSKLGPCVVDRREGYKELVGTTFSPSKSKRRSVERKEQPGVRYLAKKDGREIFWQESWHEGKYPR